MKILSEQRLVLTPAMMSSRSIRQPVERPRSPGVHVQAVNKVLGVAAGKLSDSDGDDYPFERFSDTVYPLMPALGVAWEEFRASLYPEDELLWQPYELERDGIFGTPDGIWLGGEHAAVWECKQTTKKFQRIDTLWMYVKQGMSYCAMNGMCRVLYDLCFVLGDYTRPYQPIATTTLVEFEEREVEGWWKQIVATAKEVRPERL